MRLMVVSVTALVFSTTLAFAGGGTVTSTEPGPPPLTEEATVQILSTVGIVPIPETFVPIVTYEPPAKAKVTYTAPAKAKVTYTPPAKAKIIYAPPPVAPSEQTKLATEVKTAEAPTGPLNPRDIIRQCSTCHGVDGIARIPTAPNIAGSSRGYLETQLKAFRSGKRENEVMSVIAEGLSNAEIKAAAKWYAAIKVAVEVPE